jgi:hypothetical protein
MAVCGRRLEVQLRSSNVVAGVLGVLLTGCAAMQAASFPAGSEPAVRFDGLHPTQVVTAGLNGGPLRLGLEITNPNAWALELYELELRLTGDLEAELAPQSESLRVQVPAWDSARFEVEMEITGLNLPEAQASPHRAPVPRDVRVRGALRFQTPEGSRQLPIDQALI